MTLLDPAHKFAGSTVAPRRAFNLLDLPLFKRLMKSRWYPAILAWPTLVIFAFITYQLVTGPSQAHDNFGTALTWVLWWPILPIMFLFAGRIWCTLCPFGTINDLVQKFVGNRKPVPRFLKTYGIWIIDAVFLLITWSDHLWGVVESPLNSGILLLLITLGVVVSGAFFERRTWCRYLCFLGGLSGNYTRGGMIGLSATPEICATCTTQACFKGTENGRGKVAGCPMFIFPRTMESNADCNLCGNCVKSCPNDSIRITTRLPSEELWFVRKPQLPVAFLASVIMGIVFVQNITMLEVWNRVLAWFEGSLGISYYPLAFTIAFLALMAIPVGLLFGASALAKRSNGKTVLENFARFGYAIIPLDMAGHIAHNLFHLLAEGKAIGFTALGLFGGSVREGSAAIVDSATIQVLQYALIVLGTAASLYTAWRLTKSTTKGPAKNRATFASYGFLMVLFAGINIYLFSMPMGMRM
jgi:ferredoxin